MIEGILEPTAHILDTRERGSSTPGKPRFHGYIGL